MRGVDVALRVEEQLVELLKWQGDALLVEDALGGGGCVNTRAGAGVVYAVCVVSRMASFDVRLVHENIERAGGSKFF